METTKKKKNDIQPRKSLWRQHYPLVFAILNIIMLFFFFQIMFSISMIESSTVLYPYLGAGVFINFAVLYFVFPSSFLFVLVGIFKRNISKERTTITMWSDIFAFLLTFLAGLMTLVVIFVLIITSDTYGHKDTLNLSNHTYILSGQNSYDDLGYGKFALYQCDNRVLFCSKIYETNWGHYTSRPAELAFDDTTQEITIIINGEVVHSHPLE